MPSETFHRDAVYGEDIANPWVAFVRMNALRRDAYGESRLSTMQTKQTPVLLLLLAASTVALALASPCRAADPGAKASPPADGFWTKPDWLSDLSFAARESYDDNVFGVSGLGLQPKVSWVDSVSASVGLNLVPLLGPQKDIQALSLSYNPERVVYESVSSQDYTANRVNATLKGKAGRISYSIVDAFLYNDGNKVAPTYALNQLAGAAGNQNDKYRSNYAHGLARERLDQVQDRYTASVQFDGDGFFVRPVSQLTYYNLDTDLFNTSVAPYKGYQDYVDRYDVNGGLDFGVRLTPAIAVTLGYRDGYQHQDQFALAINSDRHFSSNNYQRALLGLEGKLAKWLTLKLAAGPDFRDYNPGTPISNLHTTRYYGEATATATLPGDQSLTLGYKQYLFVSSTGLVPYEDISGTLAYHWNATRQVGVDLGAKYSEANYSLGNDTAGSAPSLRDDVDKNGSAGVSYAVTRQFILSVTYNYDYGFNNLGSLPASLFPGYRSLTHNVVALGAQYRF